MVTTETPTNNKSKTSDLPGMTGKGVAPVKIAAVDEAVETYVSARDKRMRLTEKEVEAKIALIEVLKKNETKIGRDKDGVLTYRHDELIVTMKHEDKVKVRTEKDEDDED